MISIILILSNTFSKYQSNVTFEFRTHSPRCQKNDPWHNVRLYLDKQFIHNFVQDENICIDESLIGMESQYTPKKWHCEWHKTNDRTS